MSNQETTCIILVHLMSYSSLHSGNYPSSSDIFMKWNISGPSLLGFLKSCFPYIYYSRKPLSSRLKLSSSARKERLTAKVWEAEQVISCLEGNTWKHYLSTENIRMQENAFKYISSEGKTFTACHEIVKVDITPPVAIKLCIFMWRTAGSGYVWCIPFIKQVSRVKRTDSLSSSNAVACENSMKDKNPIVNGTEKVTEQIFLCKGAETTVCELTPNR